ncbi:hypothetical protein KEM48_003420 [Puccinia striiformis f. sp. tritici PST-130]|nr:hypothetical protein KEM48_003420 [Puccinia striiformis f. sp. tritici PST-130]
MLTRSFNIRSEYSFVKLLGRSMIYDIEAPLFQFASAYKDVWRSACALFTLSYLGCSAQVAHYSGTATQSCNTSQPRRPSHGACLANHNEVSSPLQLLELVQACLLVTSVYSSRLYPRALTRDVNDGTLLSKNNAAFTLSPVVKEEPRDQVGENEPLALIKNCQQEPPDPTGAHFQAPPNFNFLRAKDEPKLLRG